MHSLEIVHLSKRYAIRRQVFSWATRAVQPGTEIEALRDLNLSVRQGEFVVLLGPSGCGKSTLLQIVAGLELASSGQVLLDGRPIGGWSAERTLIFQKPNLFPWLNAIENVAFGLRMMGRDGKECLYLAQEALQNVGLGAAAQLYPHELSGGMQQRVALARALVLDPAVLLMDEPLASLDALLRARLQRDIRRACQGKTVLFVTHSIHEALVLADRLVILSPRPGRVQREIAPEGVPPRSMSPALAKLEEEIERKFLSGVQNAC